MPFPNLKDISRKRKILGLTQNQLAKKVGISQSLLTKIERGIVVPNYNIATGIFDSLEELEHGDEKLAKDLMHTNVITLKPSDTVQKVVGLVKRYSISQFPIVDDHKIIGSIASTDLIGKMKTSRIKEIIGAAFPTVNENTPKSVIKNILKGVRAVIVLDSGEIKGIITAEDLL